MLLHKKALATSVGVSIEAEKAPAQPKVSGDLPVPRKERKKKKKEGLCTFVKNNVTMHWGGAAVSSSGLPSFSQGSSDKVSGETRSMR